MMRSILVPLLVTVGVFVAYLLGGEAFYYGVRSQTSVLEAITGLVIIAALVVGLQTIRPASKIADARILRWMILFCVAMLFYAGEDQNWGQYYIGWNAPEYFQLHNKEQETNLHNMSSWFNQKPRLMVEIWVLVLGILVPLGWEWPKKATARFLPDLFWTGRELMPVAVGALIVGWVDRLTKLSSYQIEDETGIRLSEVQEFWFGWMMLLYALIVLRRVTIELVGTKNDRVAE